MDNSGGGSDGCNDSGEMVRDCSMVAAQNKTQSKHDKLRFAAVLDSRNLQEISVEAEKLTATASSTVVGPLAHSGGSSDGCNNTAGMALAYTLLTLPTNTQSQHS